MPIDDRRRFAARPGGGERALTRALRWPLRMLAAIAFLLLGPLSVLAFGGLDLDTHWSAASRESTGQAPAPLDEAAAVVQVYGARTWGCSPRSRLCRSCRPGPSSAACSCR